MFAPLQETLKLLAAYDHEMPEEIHVMLEAQIKLLLKSKY